MTRGGASTSRGGAGNARCARGSGAVHGRGASSTRATGRGSGPPRNSGGRRRGPEWEFVKEFGDNEWECIFCGYTSVNGSATRIRAHILRETSVGVMTCSASADIRKDAVERLSRLDAIRKTKNTSRSAHARDGDEQVEDELNYITPPAAAAAPFYLPEGGLGSIGVSTGEKRRAETIEIVARQTKQKKVDQCLTSEQLKKAQLKVVEAFLYAGLSPHVLEHKAMKEAFQEVAKAGPAFRLPSYKHANNKMLDEIHGKMVERVDMKLCRVTESRPGSLVTDGWSNVNKDHLINYMIVYPGGEVFLKTVETKTEQVTGEWIFEKTKAVIESFGPKRIYQVVMDNASNCKLAGAMLESEFPGLHATNCQCHCLNLLLKDWFSQHTWFKEPIQKVRRLVKFITTKPAVYAIYKSLRVKSLALMNPGQTRFGTNYICLERVLRCRDWIISTFNHTEFFEWERRQKGKNAFKHRQQASALRDMIGRETFWRGVQNVVRCMQPVCHAIKTLDSSKASTGKVWRCWHSIQSFLQRDGPNAPFDNAKRTLLLKDLGIRWKKSYNDIHGAAHALDPHNHDMDQHTDKEVMGSLKKVAKLHYPNASDYKKFIAELTEYQNLSGRWADEELHDALESHKKEPNMESYAWWQAHGQVTETLQALAMTILSLVSSNSASERNWSSYKYIHSVTRNRLLHKKADKLVYSFSNWRLLNRNSGAAADKLQFPFLDVDSEVDEDTFEDSDDELLAVNAASRADEDIRRTHFIDDEDDVEEHIFSDESDDSTEEESDTEPTPPVEDLTAHEAVLDSSLLPTAVTVPNRQRGKRNTSRGRGGRGRGVRRLNLCDNAEDVEIDDDNADTENDDE